MKIDSSFNELDADFEKFLFQSCKMQPLYEKRKFTAAFVCTKIPTPQWHVAGSLAENFIYT
mgnify:CR=1 FL=1